MKKSSFVRDFSQYALETFQDLSLKKKFVVAAVGFVTLGNFVPSLWINGKDFFIQSEGARIGVMTKFSDKGFWCTTGEGQLAQPNFSNNSSDEYDPQQGNDNTFYFSVESEAVKQQILKAMDSGKTVKLEYKQHYIAPHNLWPFGTCKRRTEYEVTGVVPVKNQAPYNQIDPTPKVKVP
jgi:hypothetical protein